ncbi:glycine cleavage system protein GcvH [Flavobacterium zepuense]|uniref:Glycine cleavage system H protein n=1 Tax=Flavobacterium zepuense TaxID=2593302 RepID=A0A552US90_9FLAO|nr:glycine cleavage system protein GcvH [Flavobacterium zepuense]TRW21047.1 glycine cleavage system protein GcvH [Flavobacterium zepuense]
MEFSENLLYSKEHTWLKVEGNTAIIGITEFAQSELGEIVYVELPNVGQSFAADEVFGSVEAVKTTSDLFMPVAGKVIEVNEALVQKPELVNTDPFGTAWLIRIEIKNQSEINNLLTSGQYNDMVGK